MFLRTSSLASLDATPNLRPGLQASWVPLAVYRQLPSDILREFAMALSEERYHDDVRELLLQEAVQRQDIALALVMLAKQKGGYTSLDFFKTLATGQGSLYHDLATLVWQKICPMPEHETRLTFQWLLDGLDTPAMTRELAVQVTRALFGGVTQWIEGDATASSVFEGFAHDRRQTIRNARRETPRYGSWVTTTTFTRLLQVADEAGWRKCDLDGQVVRSLQLLEREALDTLCKLDCGQWQMLVTMLYSVGVVTTGPVDAVAVLATITSV